MARSAEEIARRFAYHAPDDDRRRAHERVRALLGDAAEELRQVLPEGRDKSMAFASLEEAMFWANAAIAREV